MLIEICASSLQSACNAQAGGTGRFELCDNLYEVGTQSQHCCAAVGQGKTPYQTPCPDPPSWCRFSLFRPGIGNYYKGY